MCRTKRPLFFAETDLEMNKKNTVFMRRGKLIYFFPPAIAIREPIHHFLRLLESLQPVLHLSFAGCVDCMTRSHQTQSWAWLGDWVWAWVWSVPVIIYINLAWVNEVHATAAAPIAAPAASPPTLPGESETLVRLEARCTIDGGNISSSADGGIHIQYARKFCIFFPTRSTWGRPTLMAR